MDHFFEQYSWTILEIIAGFFSLVFLMSIFTNTVIINSDSMKYLNASLNAAQVEYSIPKVKEFIVYNGFLDKNSDFDWKNYVTAKSEDSKDLIDYVTVTGKVDTTIPGKYEILYKLYFHGYSLMKKAVFIVKE